MKCGKPASHKFVKIEKNQIYDMYFCQEHASERSPYLKPKIPLSEILASFLSQEQGAQQATAAEPDLKCSSCGLTFEDYRRSLMLGCPGCYEAFQEYLLPELRKFHGATRHIGRRPDGQMEIPEQPEIEPELELSPSVEPEPGPSTTHGAGALIQNPSAAIHELSRAMNKAIREEDFEKAALCRDQIRELRSQPKKK